MLSTSIMRGQYSLDPTLRKETDRILANGNGASHILGHFLRRKSLLTELVVLVDFVFPWGIEYPVVYLPQGLFTLGCLQIS